LAVPLPADVGAFCSLALDSRRHPCIACWRDFDGPQPKLVFVHGEDDVFQEETILPTHGTGSAIAVDSADQPWVAFYDLDASALRAAHRPATVWLIEAVAASLTGFAATTLSIRLDSAGVPHIAFGDGSGLRLARRQSDGTWAVEEVAPEATAV